MDVHINDNASLLSILMDRRCWILQDTHQQICFPGIWIQLNVIFIGSNFGTPLHTVTKNDLFPIKMLQNGFSSNLSIQRKDISDTLRCKSVHLTSYEICSIFPTPAFAFRKPTNKRLFHIHYSHCDHWPIILCFRIIRSKVKYIFSFYCLTSCIPVFFLLLLFNAFIHLLLLWNAQFIKTVQWRINCKQ